MRTALYLLLAITLGSITTAEDWTQFRGPNQQGVTPITNLPVKWDLQNATWKTPLPGLGWSSPVISGGKTYLTTAVPVGEEVVKKEGKFSKVVETPYSLRVVCIDCENGNKIWDKEVFKLPAEISIHPKNSHASPTPLIVGERLFVHFGTHGTAALDLDGNVIWNKTIEYKPQHGSGGSPVPFDDLLIFNCDGSKKPFVIALDMATGDERWRTSRPEFEGLKFSFSTPTLIEHKGQPQLISAGSDFICGYKPQTGEELWQARYKKKWSVVPRPVYTKGLILTCTGYEGPAELLAIRPDGQEDVTDTHIAWRVDKFVPYNPSLIVNDDHIYMVSDAGVACCREIATGELTWKERLKGDFSASPILAGDRIYFLSEDGICTVVKANPEKFERLAENKSNERTFASITPLDGALLLRTEKNLYRID